MGEMIEGDGEDDTYTIKERPLVPPTAMSELR